MSNTIANGVLVRLLWDIAGAPYAINALHYRAPVGLTVTQALATEVGGAVAAKYVSAAFATVQSDQVSITSVGVRDRRFVGAPEFVGPVGATGSQLSDPLPRQVSLVGTHRTAFAGRSFRGRTFLPGFSELENDGAGRASAAAVAAAVDFLTAMRTIDTAQGQLALAIATQIQNGAPIEPGQLNDVVTTVVRDAIWDNQRRRSGA